MNARWDRKNYPGSGGVPHVMERVPWGYENRIGDKSCVHGTMRLTVPHPQR
jgi:hypothetical protein